MSKERKPLVVIKVGGIDVGDGRVWIPTQQDLNQAAKTLEYFKDDYNFVIYHHGVDVYAEVDADVREVRITSLDELDKEMGKRK